MKTEHTTLHESVDLVTEVTLFEDGRLVATCQIPSHGNAVVTEVGKLLHDRDGWHVFNLSDQMILSKPTKANALRTFGGIATIKAATFAVAP